MTPTAIFRPVAGQAYHVDLARDTLRPARAVRAFKAFRAAVRAGGGVWDRARSIFVSERAAAPEVAAALRRAGFLVMLPDDLRAEVEEIARKRREGTDPPLLPKDPLYPHQVEGIRFIRERRKNGLSCLLADDMGLGKTMQAILANDEGERIVICCPKIAKMVWARELKRWRPDLQPRILDGLESFRWPRVGEACVINYEVLPKIAFEVDDPGMLPEQLLTTCPGNVRLIGDEVHFVKEPESGRTRSFRAVSQAVRARGGTVLLLSGTPMTNRPSELWTVLQTADLGIEAFGDYEVFRRLFRGATSVVADDVAGMPDDEVPQRLARVMLRRTKVQVLKDLPPKSHELVEVDADLSDKALKRVLRRLGGDGYAEVVTARWTTLRELEGLPFEEVSAARAALALAKLPAALALLDSIEVESSEPVVVFSAHRLPAETIARRPGWALISGDTSTEERGRIEDSFQRGELRGIAATIAAAGTALTLTRAAICVFVDQEWTPAENMQAEDRIYRIGQKSPVRVLILTTRHPIDRRVNELLVEKRRLIAATVDAVANVRRI